MSEETPYEVARRMHAQGVSADEVERALRAMGLAEDDVRIASRAARGESGVASPVLREAPPPAPSLADAPPKEAPQHPCPLHPAWPVAATCTRCGKFFCHRCIRDAGLTEFPSSKQCPDCEKTHPPEKPLAGIGGWLILPAIQITVAPLVHAVLAALIVRKGSSEGIFAAVIEVLVVAYSVVTAIHFFQRKKVAVQMMLGFYLVTVLAAVITGGFEPSGIGSAIIWFAYFLQSERVKNTFTR